MTAFGNPGYPPPQDMAIVSAGGIRIAVGVKFVEVRMDRGVPTPVWELVLDGGDFSLADFVINHIEGNVPPGCIVQFPQVGDATDNAERILAKTKYHHAMRKAGLIRDIDPTATRIMPE